jgi:hypothetical protein
MRRARLPLVAALVVAACSGPAPLLKTCDVRQSDCQQDLFLALHQLRGQLWDPWTSPPRVLVLDRQRYRDLSRIQLGPPSASAWTPALRELGLLPADVDADEADRSWFTETTLGAYWSRPQLVTLVDDDKSTFDDPGSVSSLVHEYLHVAQDRELDLLSSRARLTTDREMVRNALIEGEARMFETLARLTLQHADASAAAIRDRMERELLGWRKASLSATALHAHVRRSFPYPLGGALFADAWAEGGSPGINQVYAHPPATFVEVMRAHERSSPAGPLPVDLCEPRFADPRLTWTDRDTLGAALLYATLLALTRQEEASWAAAFTWRADRMWLYQHPVHGPVRLWRVFAPGLAGTAAGAQLAARTSPPVMEGDYLLHWSPNLPDLLEALHASTGCP